MVLIRETPPLELSVAVQTPAGLRARWGRDDPNPALAPGDLSFSSAMSGGHERFSCVLQRDPQRSYPDLEPLSRLTVLGLGGGTCAWQGRLEKLPDTGGYQSQVTPEGVGYQAALEDDNTAAEIFVDQEAARWEGPTVAAQIRAIGFGDSPTGPTVSADPVSNRPALATLATGPWEAGGLPYCYALYDAKGIPIGGIYYAWERNAQIGTPEHWHWLVHLSTDDVFTAGDATANLAPGGASGSGTLNATATGRVYGIIEFFYDTAGGAQNVQYAVYWLNLAVYGRHGLPLQGTPGGLLASDVVRYTIGKWVPELATEIVPSSFVIPQLAFLEPTTAAEIIKQATRYELPDWAVWENPSGFWLPPTFYMNPRGERGRKWKSRIGPAQLQEAGPQTDRLWNGVVVQYQDVTGKTRTVGPPGYTGGNAASEDPGLQDTSMENPLNQAGIRRWTLLKMGTSTAEGAKTIGRVFLREQALLETSGQATLSGVVEDSGGILWPAWMVRAGDEISFVDSSEPGYRRVVNANYSDAQRANTIQLDQPPDAMTALLERLSVVLVGTGLT